MLGVYKKWTLLRTIIPKWSKDNYLYQMGTQFKDWEPQEQDPILQHIPIQAYIWESPPPTPLGVYTRATCLFQDTFSVIEAIRTKNYIRLGEFEKIWWELSPGNSYNFYRVLTIYVTGLLTILQAFWILFLICESNMCTTQWSYQTRKWCSCTNLLGKWEEKRSTLILDLTCHSSGWRMVNLRLWETARRSFP